MALPTAFRSFEDPYYLPVTEAFYSLESQTMPVPGQPVPVYPEELGRANDDDPPLAHLKKQVLQQDFAVDPAMRQLHRAYRFLSAEFPQIRVDSGVLFLGDPSDATHACSVVPLA